MKTRLQLTKEGPFDAPVDAVLLFCFEEDELICPKLPMKIKFSEYDIEKRYLGLRRINLGAG